MNRRPFGLAGIVGLCLVCSCSLKDRHPALAKQKIKDENIAEARQQYTCKRAVDRIETDGVLDEISWRNAEIMEFVTISKNADGVVEYGEPGEQKKVIAKMVWDDSCLYIGFEIQDEDIRATMTEHDLDLSGEDVVEIFIDPEDGQSTYGEIQVNPLNTLFDQYVIVGKKRRVWMDYWADYSQERGESAVKSGVNVVGTVANRADRDTRWTAEIAVPLHLFITAPHLPPTEGEKWRINLTAINYCKDQDPVCLTWARLGPDFFHDPDTFGEIIFSNDYVQDMEVIRNSVNIASFETLDGLSFNTSDKVKIISAGISEEDKHERHGFLKTTIQFNRSWGRFDILFDNKPELARNGELVLCVKGDTGSNAKINYEIVDASGESYVGTLTYSINWPDWKEISGLISKAQISSGRKDKIMDYPVYLTKLFIYSRKVSENTFCFHSLKFDEIGLRSHD
ncbi:MAG: carbohydrate-binding family 9-like protein [Planctomycetes bacterium]|nr:carbohydrate-binding family 9-like protein [Planctomycetota bacterium]